MTKQSEHKNIPELRFPEFKDDGEWKEESVRDVYEFKTTNSLSRENLSYDDGIIKNIHYGDIHTKFETLFSLAKEEVPYIKSDSIALDKLKKDSYCKEGDMIFADASEDIDDIGKSIEILDLNNEKLVSGLHTILARPKDTKLIVGFGGYLFKSEPVRKQIQRESQGTKVLGISATRLSNVKISFPKNGGEQKKVANCLSSLDKVITANTEKLKVLKDHKKGLIQALFPQDGERVPRYRFKEFENDEEWDLRHFSNYIVLFRGSSPRPIQEYLTKSGRGVNWIKIGDTKNANNFVLSKTEEQIIEEGALKSRKVHKGELILANSMSFGKTYLLEIEGCIYDGWFVLRNYEKHFDKQFLLQLLNSRYMQAQYEKLSAGGIVQNISSDIVYNTILPHTSINEQQKIAETLSSLDDLIVAQSEKIEELKAHKKGLMQKLFPAINE